MDKYTPDQPLPWSRFVVDSPVRSTRHAVAESCLAASLLLAIGAMFSPPVEAADSCRRGNTVVSSATGVACSLQNNDSLLVTPTGSIEVLSGAAVSVFQAAPRQILNQGQLIGEISIDIRDSQGVGKLYNTGTLSGPLRITGSRFTDKVVNAGNLSDGIRALSVRQSTLAGGFYNAGYVFSGEGVDFSNSVLQRFVNTGEFSLSEGVLSFGGSTVQGDIFNGGTVATGSDGLGGISISRTTVGGNVINQGHIEGGYFGVGLRSDDNSIIQGNLVNSGRIVGETAVVLNNLSLAGDLINGGAMIGNIRQEERHGTGLVINASDVAGTFRNGGVISGLEHGAVLTDVALGADLINRGRIVAAGDALTVVNGAIGGQWLNYGYIGTDTDAAPRDFMPQGMGVILSATTLQGRAVNRGEIRGNANGLTLDNAQLLGGLVNAGTLRGGNYALYVNESSQLDNLYIAGAGTARFQGEVYAPRTTATIYSDARYRLHAQDAWQVKTLVNRGELELAAPVLADAARASVQGDYVQKAGAVLRTQVQDSSHYGQLGISGTATLPSLARIDVDVARAQQPFTASRLGFVLSAGQLVSDGTFAVTSNSALFDFAAVKVDDHVDLTLQPKSATAMADTARAAGLSTAAVAAAGALDTQFAKGSASTLAPYFVGATSAPQVAAQLAQTLPMGNASLRANQATLSAIGNAVSQRIDVATGLTGFAEGPTGPAGFWSQPFSYSAGQSDTVEGATGTVIGFDTRTGPGRRSGWAFAYANGGTGNQQPSGQQSSRLDLWQFLGYSSYTLAPDTEWMVYGGAGRNSVEGDRRLSIGGVDGQAKGEYDSLIATLGTRIGHALQLTQYTRWTPSLRLDYNHVRDAAYNERGPNTLAPLLLKLSARDTDQLIAGLDNTLEKHLSADTRLSLNLGLGYDLINQPGTLDAAFAGAPQQRFQVNAEQSSPWLLRGGLGLVTRFDNGAEVTVNYDAQRRTDFTDQVASIKASLAF